MYDTYCRFMSNNTEFCRLELNRIKETGRNGMIVCDLSKVGNKWTIKSRNYFSKNTLCCDDAFQIL